MPSSPTLHCRSTNIVDYWCEWSTEFTGVRVVYNFQFQDSSKTWIDCSNKKYNTCRVFESDGNPMKEHLVRVTVTNMFGTATTTTKFDSHDEAIPLPPVINKLSVVESNVTVFWELQEYCIYCNSLWFQLRYRRLNETWKKTKQQQRKMQMTIEEVTTADKYEFQVRSRFSLLAHTFSEWSSIASTFPTVSLIIHASTPTASEHVLSLQWETVELGTHEYLYRITGNYIGKSLRESVNEELTVNNINLNVPCNVTENIIVYLELRRIIQVDALEIEGPPTSIHYDFQCIKEDLVTIKQPIMTERHISTTVAVQYTGSRSDLIISFLVVGIVVAFALLFGGAFKMYIHKRIFIQWPEPKFFKVEISSFSPRSVEKEFFDDLKPRKKSNFLKTYSSTSSDQGFHEFSPDSHVNEEPNTYVVVPSVGTDYQISVVNENGSNYLKNAVTTDNITLKEGSTPYFRLRKTDDYDTLQLSPLVVAEESRTDEHSNPYTKMTSVFSDKSGKNAPETNYVSDPYCKLDEVLHANVEDINPQAVSTEYTPFTGDYYDRKEEFIGEEEIENLLNCMPETVNTYDMFTY
ncbi:uncharacterized protein [Antedon mediterranea]